MKFNMSCDEATTICDKSQYDEATLMEKIKLNIHVFLCKKCGLYSKQNSILTKCYNSINENGKEHEICLCEEEKKEIEVKVKEKISS